MKKASTQLEQKIADAESLTYSSKVNPEDVALDLAATARTAFDGRIFWENDKLVYLGQAGVDFHAALSLMTTEARSEFKNLALQYAESKTVSNVTFFGMMHSLRTSLARHPSRTFTLKWASVSIENENFRHSIAQILKFLEHIQKRSSRLVDSEALNLLAQTGSRRYSSNNVQSDDPEKSWLTPDEYDAVLRTTWDFFDTTGCSQSTLIRLLSLQYARRPAQLRSLKFCDLKCGANKKLKKLQENEIHFPAAKEKDSESEFRGGKAEIHPIANHLWHLLQIQKKSIKQIFQQALDVKLSESDLDKLPVFTTASRVRKSIEWLTNNLALNPIEHLHHELFHVRTNPVLRTIAFTQNLQLDVYSKATKDRASAPPLPLSERTQKPILVSANRLRHTRARQLARQGVPKPILSYWLGHNDPTAIDSYYSDPAEEARHLDEKMSKGLIPLAMAFQGRIIVTDAEATHANDPSKRLEFPSGYTLRYVGHCGKLSFCSTTSIPIPCYRCNKFEPLVDAPHQEVLEALIYRQSQERDLLKVGGMRKLLIPIDLSADIRAVERCIELCKIKREQKHQQGQQEQTYKKEDDQ